MLALFIVIMGAPPPRVGERRARRAFHLRRSVCVCVYICKARAQRTLWPALNFVLWHGKRREQSSLALHYYATWPAHAHFLTWRSRQVQVESCRSSCFDRSTIIMLKHRGALCIKRSKCIGPFLINCLSYLPRK